MSPYNTFGNSKPILCSIFHSFTWQELLFVALFERSCYNRMIDRAITGTRKDESTIRNLRS